MTYRARLRRGRHKTARAERDTAPPNRGDAELTSEERTTTNLKQLEMPMPDADSVRAGRARSDELDGR